MRGVALFCGGPGSCLFWVIVLLIVACAMCLAGCTPEMGC
jgi:hypothetical protein